MACAPLGLVASLCTAGPYSCASATLCREAPMSHIVIAALLALTVASPPSRYEDLVALFRDWRVFQKAKEVDGPPDFTAPALAAAGESRTASTTLRFWKT